MQKIKWIDEHWAHLEGGRASVETVEGRIYLAMSLRNAGSGIAVLGAWYPHVEFDGRPPPDENEFRRHSRDLYIAGGDSGFWMAALRDPSDVQYAPLLDCIEDRRTFAVDILYSDHEGGQHTISRFTITPIGDAGWMCSVVRHWTPDRPAPR